MAELARPLFVKLISDCCIVYAHPVIWSLHTYSGMGTPSDATDDKSIIKMFSTIILDCQQAFGFAIFNFQTLSGTSRGSHLFSSNRFLIRRIKVGVT